MPRGWFWWGRGFGNPFLFCRWFPWLPRWWWAYPAFISTLYALYYGMPWMIPYMGYWRIPYSYLPY